MENDLKIVGNVPSGLITSQLFHDLLENISDEEARLPGTEDKLFASLCTSGSLLAIVTSSCGAQFSSEDGIENTKQEGETVIYKNSFQGYLDTPKDTLMGTKLKIKPTSLTVIPILLIRGEKSQRASVVFVGFSSGHVYGYSMSGQTIFSKQVHEDPISQFTFMIPSFSKRHESLATLAILSGNIVCIIEGWSLVQVIQSNVDKMNKGFGWSEYDEDMPRLAFKKWDLKDQSVVNNIAFLGHTTVSSYDYFCEASKISGFESSIRSLPSAEAKIVSVGQQPMVALYKINKDAGQVNMSKVVQAVASKTLNAVMGRISKASGWLGWGSQKEDEQNQVSKNRKLEEAYESTDLSMDCNLPDARRTIMSVTVSPLGDLAALVDAFGRVLLLECETFTIRRMWKGYRDAQCGWRLCKVESSRRNSKSVPEKCPQLTQFLCIYAARRGILEVWPAQYGKRLIAFHIGKGCQLLYSACDTFLLKEVTVSSGDKSSLKKPKYHCFAMVLTPQGELLSFNIPQGLSSDEDPRSSDHKILKSLTLSCSSGNIQDVLDYLTKLKLSSSLKLAIDSLLKKMPQLSLKVLMSIVQVALKQIQPSNTECESLYQYLRGCQHIIQLLLTLDRIKQEDKRSQPELPFNEFLQQVLEIPETLAENLMTTLQKYYEAYKVMDVQELSVYNVIQCFKLPSEVGHHLLSEQPVTESMSCHSYQPSLQLRDGAEPHLVKLGCIIFLPLMNRNVKHDQLTLILEKSLIKKQDLMILFSHFFLSGAYKTTNLTVLHQTLYECASAIDSGSLQVEDWMLTCRQCAITSNVGHALSIILIHQKMTTASQSLLGGSERGIEDWESVSTEKSHWATLYTNIEVLIHLCNIVGPSSMKHLPVVPIYDMAEDSYNNKVIAEDLVNLKFQLFNSVYQEGNMSAACLKNGGPSLVTQFLCEWILKNKINPELFSDISEVFPQVQPLLKALPSSLSEVNLLIHSSWEACYNQEEYYIGLHYLSQLRDPKILSGIIGLLWCAKFEKDMYLHIESYKKGMPLQDKAIESVSVSRTLFGYLYQLSRSSYNELNEALKDEATCDVIIFQNQNRKDLMFMVDQFPTLNSTVVSTNCELLLLFEISLKCENGPCNLLAYFPNWMRNSVKKGLFKSAWQDQVPQQLQPKRLRFLKDAVHICVHKETQPVMTPSVNSIINFTSANLVGTDITEYQDFVFLLCQLWKIPLDLIEAHWILNLFAVGLIDQGKKIFLAVSDKTAVLQDVLCLAGHVADLLVHHLEKSTKLTVLAQTPPTLLEWTRKQGTSSAVKNCIKIKPSWNCVSQILSVIVPYLSQHLKDRALQLETMIKLIK